MACSFVGRSIAYVIREEKFIRRTFLTTLLATPPLFASHDDNARRLNNAAGVCSRSRPRPTRESRKSCSRRPSVSWFVPGLKRGAFIVGAKFGKGCVSCRGAHHTGWSAPGAIRVEGGSFVFKSGARKPT